jgi:DNA polymerase III epsilon subunit-like protein
VEKVALKDIKGIAREKPATVGIVDIDGKKLIYEKIYRKPGSYLAGRKAVQVSGITWDGLKDGKPWEEVKKMIKSVLCGKLVITVNGQNDFNCLELEDDDFADTFDLQGFYRRPHPDRIGDTQPMSLRDIFFFHFNVDCQDETQPHNALIDAISTIKVFRDGYQPLKRKSSCRHERGNVEGIDFSHAVKLKKNK